MMQTFGNRRPVQKCAQNALSVEWHLFDPRLNQRWHLARIVTQDKSFLHGDTPFRSRFVSNLQWPITVAPPFTLSLSLSLSLSHFNRFSTIMVIKGFLDPQNHVPGWGTLYSIYLFTTRLLLIIYVTRYTCKTI